MVSKVASNLSITSTKRISSSNGISLGNPGYRNRSHSQSSQLSRYEEMNSYLTNKRKDAPIVTYGVIGERHQDLMSDYEKQVPRFSTGSPYDTFRQRKSRLSSLETDGIYTDSGLSYDKLKQKTFSGGSQKLGYISEKNTKYKLPSSSNSNGLSYN